jgi:hypothetical protein
MATVQNSYPPQSFRVVHPLDDVREEKCNSEGLGPIAMTRPVRLSLKVLRGYLLLMSALLVYHVLDLAGIFHHLK